MKRTPLIAFGIALSLARLEAQPIHDNPLKKFYGSAAEYPLESCQGHWMIGAVMAHLHADQNYPDGLELSAPQSWPIDLVTFQMSGGYTVRNDEQGNPLVVLDQAGFLGNDGNHYFAGDPAGVTPTLTGTAIGGTFPAHGWYQAGYRARAYFTNGDELAVAPISSAFFVTDLTQPEIPPGDGVGVRFHKCIVEVGIRDDPATVFGEEVIEVNQLLPLFGHLTDAHPWTLVARGYNYTSVGLRPIGTLKVIADPDFHHCATNPACQGITLDAISGPIEQAFESFTFPGSLTDGPHRIDWQWIATDAKGRQLLANLVFGIDVCHACADGIAQPDPQAPPPPPPPPTPPPPPVSTWITDGVLQHLGLRVRILLVDGTTIELATIP